MLRRTLAILTVLASTFAMSACSDATGPDTTNDVCGGVYAGTGTRSC
jgi:hypothetical protein